MVNPIILKGSRISQIMGRIKINAIGQRPAQNKKYEPKKYGDDCFHGLSVAHANQICFQIKKAHSEIRKRLAIRNQVKFRTPFFTKTDSTKP
jgi:hypothetical protein